MRWQRNGDECRARKGCGIGRRFDGFAPMKIADYRENPPGPAARPLFAKGAIWGFIGIDPDHCGLFSSAVLYPVGT